MAKNKFLGIGKIVAQDIQRVTRVNTIVRKPDDIKTGGDFRSMLIDIPGAMDMSIERLNKEEFQVIYYEDDPGCDCYKSETYACHSDDPCEFQVPVKLEG